MQGKMGHEMSGYVFNARAATEEYAHERTDDFTVLVTIGSATQSYMGSRLRPIKEHQIAP
jgi:hypothetical protein